MKVLVAIKRVIDPYVKIQVASDAHSVIKDNVKHAMNPFDEIAIEQAVQWLESDTVTEVMCVSVGSAACIETLRMALARGATAATHIQTEDGLAPLNVAKSLHAFAKKYQPDIILLGKQAIDDDCNQVAQMLAALMDIPQATFASDITLIDGGAQVVREVDGGLETIDIKWPAVISTDLRLNEPRYVAIPNIMKAKRKPLETVTLADLGCELQTPLKTISVSAPPKRVAGVKVESLEALLDALKNKEKVII